MARLRTVEEWGDVLIATTKRIMDVEAAPDRSGSRHSSHLREETERRTASGKSFRRRRSRLCQRTSRRSYHASVRCDLVARRLASRDPNSDQIQVTILTPAFLTTCPQSTRRKPLLGA
jgi:hypothetical protein